MRRIIGFVPLLLLLLLVQFVLVVNAGGKEVEEDNESSLLFTYVVELERDSLLSETKSILKDLEAEGILEIHDEIDILQYNVIHTSEMVAEKVSNLKGVSSMTKDYWNYIRAMGWVDDYQPHEDDDNNTKNHRHLNQQQQQQKEEKIPYGIEMVHAAGLHAITSEGIQEPKKVCIVDTGYTNGHSDLPILDESSGYTPYKNIQSTNMTTTSPMLLWDQDDVGHGTHVAGTIAAIGNNQIGVMGVNSDPDKVSLFIGRTAPGDDGVCELNHFIKTVTECVKAGADIVSMSMGSPDASQPELNMFRQFYEDNNVLFVAAAGNEGTNEYFYPASYDHVISVAAVNQDMNTPWFSQHNDQVEITAPGVGVYSTYKNNSYKYMSGTSMSVPHVSAVAALIWGHFPHCTNHQIRHALLTSAHKRASNDIQCDEIYGHGIVDAEAAYTLLSEVGCDGVEDSTIITTGVTGGCSFLSYQPSSSEGSISRDHLRAKKKNQTQQDHDTNNNNHIVVVSSLSNSCKSWCKQIPIPFKSDNPNDVQKCHFANFCNGCNDCASSNNL